MKLFVGMDVSLSASAICVLSEHGKVVEEAKVANELAALVGYLAGLSMRSPRWGWRRARSRNG
jgi:hypothetical protein